MKIVTVLGSPRPHSNSTAMAEHLVDHLVVRAAEHGAEISTHVLNSMTFRGCQACDACRRGEGTPCVVRDDLTPVLDEIRDADVLVMTSPVYFGGVTAQFKAFFDRTRAYLKPDFKTAAMPGQLAPGKQAVLLLVQADADPAHYDWLEPNYEKFLRWYNYEEVHTVRACGVRERDEIVGRADVFGELDRLAERIFGA